MAARADGHIDGKERELLSQEIAKLQPDDELHAWIQQQFDAPLLTKLNGEEITNRSPALASFRKLQEIPKLSI